MASKRGTEGGQGAGCTLTASEALSGLPDAGEQHLSHIAEPLRALAVPVASLTPDPANARKHDERNIGAIRASLSRFGQRLPIVVQKQGMIVRAGNGRLEAAKQLGWTHIAAVIVDEASIDATAYAIADNRTAELAEWDNAVLAGLLEALPKDALESSGFNSSELEVLLANIGEKIDATPAELWQGMPSYEVEKRAFRTLSIHFESQSDVDSFKKLIGQDFGDSARSIWHPQKDRKDWTEIGFVSDGGEAEPTEPAP